MTKDEILQALRLTAMGRANTPVQDQLAETIAAMYEAQVRLERALMPKEPLMDEAEAWAIEAEKDPELAASMEQSAPTILENGRAMLKRRRAKKVD